MSPARRHQWIVMVCYGLTDAEARATEAGIEQRLDAEHRMSADGPACLNCEYAWSGRLAAQSCSAEWVTLNTRDHARVRQL